MEKLIKLPYDKFLNCCLFGGSSTSFC